MKLSTLKASRTKELITCLHLIVILLDSSSIYLSLIQSLDKLSKHISKVSGIRQEKMLKDVLSFGTLMDQQKLFNGTCNFTHSTNQVNGMDVVMLMKFSIKIRLTKSSIMNVMKKIKRTKMRTGKRRKNRSKMVPSLRKEVLKKVSPTKAINPKIENISS